MSIVSVLVFVWNWSIEDKLICVKNNFTLFLEKGQDYNEAERIPAIFLKFNFFGKFFQEYHQSIKQFRSTRVGISGTTAKSRQRKFVPSSHPGPFALVATSRKSQTKVGTLACFDLL